MGTMAEAWTWERRREFRGNDEEVGAALQGKPPPYGHPLSKGGVWGGSSPSLLGFACGSPPTYATIDKGRSSVYIKARLYRSRSASAARLSGLIRYWNTVLEPVLISVVVTMPGMIGCRLPSLVSR